MIVALGMDVSVYFILSNAWMKHIGSFLDHGANQLRMPLHDYLHNFRITYRAPQKYVPYPDLRSSNEIAFMALPKIEVLLSVMTSFNPKSPCLGSARDMVRIIQALAGIPPITAHLKMASSFLHKEYMDTTLDDRFMTPPTPDVLNRLGRQIPSISYLKDLERRTRISLLLTLGRARQFCSQMRLVDLLWELG